MGLNLLRVQFDEWLDGSVPRRRRTEFLEGLFEHVGGHLEVTDWTKVDSESEPSPKVASYTGYGIFTDCLRFLTMGDYGEELQEGEDWELEALVAFRNSFEPASLDLPIATHFTEVGASDAIFIPADYGTPFEFGAIAVASKPAARNVLQRLADVAEFNLLAEHEVEQVNNVWMPLATVKNIARIIARYFDDDPMACVAYV